MLNRSSRLEELTTSAFDVLRAHLATDGHQGSMLYALRRAVAGLGHCDPPVRTSYTRVPDIDGADMVWAE